MKLAATHFELYYGAPPDRHEQAIQQLEAENIQRQYGDLPSEQIRHYQEAAHAARYDLNTAVGGPLLASRNQAYARDVSMLAVQEGVVCAYMHVADNVSGRLPVIGSIERWAKMHVSLASGRRFLWIAQVLVSEQVGNAIQQNPDAGSVLDVMYALSVYAYKRRGQPVSSYIPAQETVTARWLESIGMTPQEGAAVEAPMFGADSQVALQRWLGGSALEVHETVMGKPGVSDAAYTAVQSLDPAVQKKLYY